MKEDELLKYYKVPESVPAVYTPISPEERKKRVAELNDRVKENVLRIQNSDEFRAFLIAMSHFHRYSWNNQMLIWLQKADASKVAGFNTWRDLGRYVKKGEEGILILAPLGPTAAISWVRGTDNAIYAIKRSAKGWAIWDDRENMVEDGLPSYTAAGRKLKDMGFVEHRETLSVNNFKVVHVFDISQTDGKPLPQFDVPTLTGEANQELYDDLLALASSQDMYVMFKSKPEQDPSIKGSYEPPNLIWVRPEEPPAQQLKTLLHEFAHHYSESVFGIPRADAETIAESAAYIIGAHYGFDTGVRSFPYVALWAKDEKTLYANMRSVQEVAEKIIDQIEAQRTMLIPMAGYDLRTQKELEDLRAMREASPPGKGIRLADLESFYPRSELESMARSAGINPSGKSKAELCKELVNKGVLK